MTTEEAIKILASAPQWDRKSKDAICMAIEALRRQDVTDTNVGDTVYRKQAIDTVTKHYRAHDNDLLEVIAYEIGQLPSVEPQIIRCKDCKHNPHETWFECPMALFSDKQRPETAWCWKGEKKEDA